MAASSRPLVTFNAGELDESLWSRFDLEKSASACRKLENMIVETYGTARRRPGTRFMAIVGPDFISETPPPES